MIKNIEQELKEELKQLLEEIKEEFISKAKNEFEAQEKKAKKVVSNLGSLEEIQNIIDNFDKQIVEKFKKLEIQIFEELHKNNETLIQKLNEMNKTKEELENKLKDQNEKLIEKIKLQKEQINNLVQEQKQENIEIQKRLKAIEQLTVNHKKFNKRFKYKESTQIVVVE